MFGKVISEIKGAGFLLMEPIESSGLKVKLVTMGTWEPFNLKFLTEAIDLSARSAVGVAEQNFVKLS